ncbi:MAG: hypothetical protein JWM00_622 [Candidatus Saccharibacteria bacterium]|nr:hypothetical protein [Candidatus Saccharibacteria bacterium]
MIMDKYPRGRSGVKIVINKNTLQHIRDQEMDRKEFLKYSGVVLLSLLGLKGIIMLFEPSLRHQTIVSTKEKETTARGFGSGKYGA